MGVNKVKIRRGCFLLFITVLMAGCGNEEDSTPSSITEEEITSKQGTHATEENSSPFEELDRLSDEMDVAFESSDQSKWQGDFQEVMNRWKLVKNQYKGIETEDYEEIENELHLIETELQGDKVDEVKLKSMMKEVKMRIDLLKLKLE